MNYQNKEKNHRFLDRGKILQMKHVFVKVLYIQCISLLAYPDKCITVLILFSWIAQAKFTEFKIQNMVGSCDVRFPIRLEGLVLAHSQFSR